jgi:hypothetical protein
MSDLQGLHTPSSPQPTARSSSSRARWQWRILSVLAAVSVAGVAWQYWVYSPPLTPGERDIVGKWVIPIGPNPPPANAVRTFYEFRTGRRLIVHSVPISDHAASSSMTGTWRVEDGHLVMEAAEPETRRVGERVLNRFGMSSPKLFGDNPGPSRMKSRFRILGLEGGTLRLEDQPGSTLPLERHADVESLPATDHGSG